MQLGSLDQLKDLSGFDACGTFFLITTACCSDELEDDAVDNSPEEEEEEGPGAAGGGGGGGPGGAGGGGGPGGGGPGGGGGGGGAKEAVAVSPLKEYNAYPLQKTPLGKAQAKSRLLEKKQAWGEPTLGHNLARTVLQ